eukprot:176619-Pleurochrysis_carterae.AAC.3
MPTTAALASILLTVAHTEACPAGIKAIAEEMRFTASMVPGSANGSAKKCEGAQLCARSSATAHEAIWWQEALRLQLSVQPAAGRG